ncbi:hypothetical protein ACFL5N_02645, partial [bacterium]
FVFYNTRTGEKLYNITDKKEVQEAISIQKPFSIHNKIFTFYNTEKHKTKRLYNITDKKKVKIHGAISIQKPFSIGNKIFTFYNTEKHKTKRLYNITDKKNVEDFVVFSSSRHISPKKISKIDLEILKKVDLKKTIYNIRFQYKRDNYISNILNISQYSTLRNIIIKYPKYNCLLKYLCIHLASNELAILDKLLMELRPKILCFLLTNLNSDVNNLNMVNKIKSIVRLKTEQARKQVFKEYIMVIYDYIKLFKNIPNDVIKCTVLQFFSNQILGSMSFNVLSQDEYPTTLLKNAMIYNDDKLSITKILNRWEKISQIKKITSIRDESQWLKFWEHIDILKKYLEEETDYEIYYIDVIRAFPNPNLKKIKKIVEIKKSFLSLTKKSPLIIEKDIKGKLQEMFNNGSLFRTYNKIYAKKNGIKKTFVMPPLLEELNFKNWKSFRQQIILFFPKISVNKIMRQIRKIFKDLKELDPKNYSGMACSV